MNLRKRSRERMGKEKMGVTYCPIARDLILLIFWLLIQWTCLYTGLCRTEGNNCLWDTISDETASVGGAKVIN